MNKVIKVTALLLGPSMNRILSLCVSTTILLPGFYAAPARADQASLDQTWSASAMTPKKCKDFARYLQEQQAKAEALDQAIAEQEQSGRSIFRSIDGSSAVFPAVFAGISALKADFYNAHARRYLNQMHTQMVDPAPLPVFSALAKRWKVVAALSASAAAVLAGLSLVASAPDSQNKYELEQLQLELNQIRSSIERINLNCMAELRGVK